MAFLPAGEKIEIITAKSQRAVTKINNWTNIRTVKLNETKSNHVTFNNKKYNA